MASLRILVKKSYIKLHHVQSILRKTILLLAISELSALLVPIVFFIIDLIKLISITNTFKNSNIQNVDIDIYNNNITFKLILPKRLPLNVEVHEFFVYYKNKQINVKIAEIDTKIENEKDKAIIKCKVMPNNTINNKRSNNNKITDNLEDVITSDILCSSEIYCIIKLSLKTFFSASIKIKPHVTLKNILDLSKNKINNKKIRSNSNFSRNAENNIDKSKVKDLLSLKKFSIEENDLIFEFNYFNKSLDTLDVKFNDIEFEFLFLNHQLKLIPKIIVYKDNILKIIVNLTFVNNNTSKLNNSKLNPYSIYNYDNIIFLNTNVLVLKDLINKKFEFNKVDTLFKRVQNNVKRYIKSKTNPKNKTKIKYTDDIISINSDNNRRISIYISNHTNYKIDKKIQFIDKKDSDKPNYINKIKENLKGVLFNEMYNYKNNYLCNVNIIIHDLSILNNNVFKYSIEIIIENIIKKDIILLQELYEEYVNNKIFYLVNLNDMVKPIGNTNIVYINIDSKQNKNEKLSDNKDRLKLFLNTYNHTLYINKSIDKFLMQPLNKKSDKISLKLFLHTISIENSTLTINTILDKELIYEKYPEEKEFKNKFYNVDNLPILMFKFEINIDIVLKNNIPISIRGNNNLIKTQVNNLINTESDKNNKVDCNSLKFLLDNQHRFSPLPITNFINYYIIPIYKKIIPFDIKLTNIVQNIYTLKIDINRYLNKFNYKNNPISKNIYESINTKHIIVIDENNSSDFELFNKYEKKDSKSSESVFYRVFMSKNKFNVYMGKEIILDDFHISFRNPRPLFNFLFDSENYLESTSYINILTNMIKWKFLSTFKSNTIKNIYDLNKTIYNINYDQPIVNKNELNKNDKILDSEIFEEFFKAIELLMIKSKRLTKLIKKVSVFIQKLKSTNKYLRPSIRINRPSYYLYRVFEQIYIEYIEFLEKYSLIIENLHILGDRIKYNKILDMINLITITLERCKSNFPTYKSILDCIFFNIKELKWIGEKSETRLVYMENKLHLITDFDVNDKHYNSLKLSDIELYAESNIELINMLKKLTRDCQDYLRIIINPELVKYFIGGSLEINYSCGEKVEIKFNREKDDHYLYFYHFANDLSSIIETFFINDHQMDKIIKNVEDYGNKKSNNVVDINNIYGSYYFKENIGTSLEFKSREHDGQPEKIFTYMAINQNFLDS